MAFGYRGDPAWLVTHPILGDGDGKTFGTALVPGALGRTLAVIFSNGEIGEGATNGWEHVSVSMAKKVPTWIEMAYVKDLFWDEEDCVVQFHPPRSRYRNFHPNCLHLWRPIGVAIPVPDLEMV